MPFDQHPEPAGNRYWTDREKEFVLTMNAEWYRCDAIAEFLPGRSGHAVRQLLARLGVHAAHQATMPDRWSEYEDRIIREGWVDEGLTAAAISERLPGRSRNAVIGRAHRLKLSARKSPIKRAVVQHSSPTACQWIDKPAPPFTDADKCGRKTKDGSAYCDEHHARAHRGVRWNPLLGKLEAA